MKKYSLLNILILLIISNITYFVVDNIIVWLSLFALQESTILAVYHKNYSNYEYIAIDWKVYLLHHLCQTIAVIYILDKVFISFSLISLILIGIFITSEIWIIEYIRLKKKAKK